MRSIVNEIVVKTIEDALAVGHDEQKEGIRHQSEK